MSWDVIHIKIFRASEWLPDGAYWLGKDDIQKSVWEHFEDWIETASTIYADWDKTFKLAGYTEAPRLVARPEKGIRETQWIFESASGAGNRMTYRVPNFPDRAGMVDGVYYTEKIRRGFYGKYIGQQWGEISEDVWDVFGDDNRYTWSLADVHKLCALCDEDSREHFLNDFIDSWDAERSVVCISY